MARKDIYKDAKNGFDKNPQNINRKGRPKKSWNAFNEKYKDQGIKPLTKETYYETITILMSLTLEEMDEELKNKENPQWLLWIIGLLKNPSTREKVITDHRNWCFGKAQENVNVTGNVSNDINITIDGIDLKEKPDAND